MFISFTLSSSDSVKRFQLWGPFSVLSFCEIKLLFTLDTLEGRGLLSFTTVLPGHFSTSEQIFFFFFFVKGVETVTVFKSVLFYGDYSWWIFHSGPYFPFTYPSKDRFGTEHVGLNDHNEHLDWTTMMLKWYLMLLLPQKSFGKVRPRSKMVGVVTEIRVGLTWRVGESRLQPIKSYKVIVEREEEWVDLFGTRGTFVKTL